MSDEIKLLFELADSIEKDKKSFLQEEYDKKLEDFFVLFAQVKDDMRQTLQNPVKEKDKHDTFRQEKERTDNQDILIENLSNELENLKRELNQQVAFRTRKLNTANEILVKEINRRKQAEIERNYLARLVEETDDIAVVRDETLHIIAANLAFAKTAGKVAAKLTIGKKNEDLYQNAGKEWFAKQNSIEKEVQQLQKGEMISYEETIVYPDEATHYFFTKKFPIFDKRNKLLATATISRDITKLKMQENQLKELNEKLEQLVAARTIELKQSETRYRSLVVNSPLGIIYIAPNGKILEANRRAVEILDFESISDMKKVNIKKYQLLQKTKYISHFETSKQLNTLQVNQMKYYKRDGSKFYLKYSFTPIENENGEIAGVLSNLEDITHRRQGEIALRESEKKFREFAELLPEIVYELDIEGKLTFVNKRAYQIFGYTEEELKKGLYVIDMVTVNDRKRAMKNMKLLFSGQKVRQGNEYTVVSKDGEKFHVLLYNSVIKKENKITGARGVMVNISHRKRMETELIQAKVKAIEANKAKSRFLTNISHEIRTPLNAIIGFAEILLEQIPDGSDFQNYVDAIQKSGNSLLQLINEILDLSKIEAGRMDINYEAIDPTDILHEVKQIFNIKTSEKGLQLITIVKNAPKQAVLMDDLKVRQILFNLIDNAIKFTSEGSITLCLNSKETEHGIDLIFSVKDTGTGIPQTQIDAIFEPFKQKEGQNKRKYGGTGLGLSISKRLAKMMNGTIDVSSTVGKGSEFVLRLSGVRYAHQLSSQNKDKTKDNKEPKQKDETELLFEKTKQKLTAIQLTDNYKKRLENELMLMHKKVSSVMLINDIKHFAKAIISLDNQSGVEILTPYGQLLLKNAESFQIQKITRLLSIFPEIATIIINS